jgi:osmoprotectant transport system substrate-binding protein
VATVHERRRRPLWRLTWGLVALSLLAAACGSDAPDDSPPEDPSHPIIQVASFDFAESTVIAEVYATALAEHGYPVERILGLGVREIVEPALEQGKVDLVPEYLGTALTFLRGGERTAPVSPASSHAELKRLFGARGVLVLDYAPAEDANGTVVSRALAERRNLRRTSDLVPLAPSLVYGGPPECPDRPLCLKGLESVYGLRFESFEPMPSRAITAALLQSGEIDVGMLETSDAHLAAGRLVLLADDRGLQPAENIVPVVRAEVVAAYGSPFTDLVDKVSARLDSADLIGMNKRALLDGQPPARVAVEWLREERL